MKEQKRMIQLQAQIAKARQLVEKPLPPDPEGMNNNRAGWAATAIDAFIDETGTEKEDALGDLLANLMHWCDRQPLADGYDFNVQLQHALEHYAAETSNE